ncbi:hypothetical protein QFZ43_000875 [Streptomyces afghaniensis]|nr:hypothetical protein [Streptomyces afghaniensis]
MSGMDELSEDEIRDLLERDGDDGDVAVGWDEDEYDFEPR